MIVTNAQGGRVLVQSEGNIALFVENDTRRRFSPQLWRRLAPVLTSLALLTTMVTAAVAIYEIEHEQIIARERQTLLEQRLMMRIQALDDRVQTSLAGQETRSADRSDRLVEHVDVVGREIESVAGKVDGLPTTIQQAAQGSTNALIGWLSALAPKPAAPPPLTVRPADSRAPRRRTAQ